MSRDKQPGKPRLPDAATVVHRWAELWSAQDVSGADGVFASDLHDHRAAPARDIEGIDAEKQFITRVHSAFPDLHVEIEDTVVDGDRVAARVMHRGTHGGDFFGIAPTGRPVAYEGTVIFRIADGKVAERWGTVDLFAILWQLGLSTTFSIGPGFALTHA